MTNIPTVNQYIMPENKPENRKDLLLMWEMCIKDCVKTRDTQGQIAGMLNWFIVAFAEIPDEKYEKEKVFQLEPSFNKTKRNYIQEMNIITPELIYMHISNMEKWRKEEYLKLLQIQKLTVESLLKKHTNWYFNEEVKQTKWQ